MLLSGITTLGKTVLLDRRDHVHRVGDRHRDLRAQAASRLPAAARRVPPRLGGAVRRADDRGRLGDGDAGGRGGGARRRRRAGTSEGDRGRRRPAGDAAAGKAGLRERRVRRLPHARGRGRERRGRPEPRRGEAARGARRRARHERRWARCRPSGQLTETQIADVAAYVVGRGRQRKDSVRARVPAEPSRGHARIVMSSTGLVRKPGPTERGSHETSHRSWPWRPLSPPLTAPPHRGDRNAVRRRHVERRDPDARLQHGRRGGDERRLRCGLHGHRRDDVREHHDAVRPSSTSPTTTARRDRRASRSACRRRRARRTCSSTSGRRRRSRAARRTLDRVGNLIGSTEPRFETARCCPAGRSQDLRRGARARRLVPGDGHLARRRLGLCVHGQGADRPRAERQDQRLDVLRPEDAPPTTRRAQPGAGVQEAARGLGAAAFRSAYGTNANGANAFGKCVSAMARMKNDLAALDRGRADRPAAERCAKAKTTRRARARARAKRARQAVRGLPAANRVAGVRLDVGRRGAARGNHRFPRARTERAGFEPATQLSPRTRFPVALLRPLGHLSEGKP